MDGLLQFKTVAVVIAGIGRTVLTGTLTVATLVEVQPAAEVTVKEKGPGPFTVGLAEVPPLTIPVPLQTYVPPPEPVRTRVGFEQVIEAGGVPGLATGKGFKVICLV